MLFSVLKLKITVIQYFVKILDDMLVFATQRNHLTKPECHFWFKASICFWNQKDRERFPIIKYNNKLSIKDSSSHPKIKINRNFKGRKLKPYLNGSAYDCFWYDFIYSGNGRYPDSRTNRPKSVCTALIGIMIIRTSFFLDLLILQDFTQLTQRTTTT